MWLAVDQDSRRQVADFLGRLGRGLSSRTHLNLGPVRNSAALPAGSPDLSGYTRVIIASHASHALKEHGPGSAKWDGGDRLSAADFTQIDAVVANADQIRVYTRKTETRIKYEARIGRRDYVYVETISAKQRRVGFKTMWRKRVNPRGSRS